MAFDIARALGVIRSNPTSFLDRLLSYMYFADLDIVEQSEWDHFGGGVAIIGSKGSDAFDRGVLMTCPLPSGGVDACMDEPMPLARQMDLVRLVDLMAKLWAASEFIPAQYQRCLHVAIYRSGPFAEALGGMVRRIAPLRSRFYLMHAPVGEVPVVSGQSHAAVVFETRAKAPHARLTEGSLLRLRAIPRPDDPCPARFLTTFLDEAHRMEAEAGLRIVELWPAYGSDFAPPLQVDFVALAPARGLPLPANWATVEGSSPVMGKRPGLHESLITAHTFLTALDEEVRRHWTIDAGPAPAMACLPVGLSRWEDSVQLLVEFAIPAMPLRTPEASAEAIVAAAAARATSARCPGHATMLFGGEPTGPADGMSMMDPTWPLTAASIADGVGAPAALMGPRLSEVVADPGETGLRYAKAYLETLHRLADRT